MSRIILITGYFDVYDNDGYPTGEKEFIVSHGFYEDTFKYVVVENVHPRNITGAYFDAELHEWCVNDL